MGLGVAGRSVCPPCRGCFASMDFSSRRKKHIPVACLSNSLKLQHQSRRCSHISVLEARKLPKSHLQAATFSTVSSSRNVSKCSLFFKNHQKYTHLGSLVCVRCAESIALDAAGAINLIVSGVAKPNWSAGWRLGTPDRCVCRVCRGNSPGVGVGVCFDPCAHNRRGKSRGDTGLLPRSIFSRRSRL